MTGSHRLDNMGYLRCNAGVRKHQDLSLDDWRNFAGEVRYCVAVTPPLHLADVRIEKDALMANTTGTIKRLTDKGFGFIAAPDGVEYFFHQSACQGTRFDDLREGQRVTFDVGQGPKGPRAENVKPA